MPEWPEVEFCRRRLVEWAKGKRINNVWAEPGPPLRGQSPEVLSEALVGRRIDDVRRKGKQLVWTLDDDSCLLLHLGMTGKWLLIERGAPRGAHIRMSVAFEQGLHRIDYLDPRKFGRVKWVTASEFAVAPEWAGLGPDAMFLCQSPDDFVARISGKRSSIKSVLMNQKVLSGVGNIYAAEALFMCGIDPRTPASMVSSKLLIQLAQALSSAMADSLNREKGQQIRYLQDGRAENPFQVYGREGEVCPNCGGIIRRFQQHGRSTFWCSACQPAIQ